MNVVVGARDDLGRPGIAKVAQAAPRTRNRSTRPCNNTARRQAVPPLRSSPEVDAPRNGERSFLYLRSTVRLGRDAGEVTARVLEVRRCGVFILHRSARFTHQWVGDCPENLGILTPAIEG